LKIKRSERKRPAKRRSAPKSGSGRVSPEIYELAAKAIDLADDALRTYSMHDGPPSAAMKRAAALDAIATAAIAMAAARRLGAR
jgi:hypothetical protein